MVITYSSCVFLPSPCLSPLYNLSFPPSFLQHFTLQQLHWISHPGMGEEWQIQGMLFSVLLQCASQNQYLLWAWEKHTHTHTHICVHTHRSMDPFPERKKAAGNVQARNSPGLPRQHHHTLTPMTIQKVCFLPASTHLHISHSCH